MTGQIADAHAHVQRLVLVVKMVTVLEEYITAEQRSVVCFLWAKGLNAKYIHTDIIPVFVGKCRVKMFTTGSRNVADISMMTKRLKRTSGSG
jgi:hypothetical protein